MTPWRASRYFGHNAIYKYKKLEISARSQISLSTTSRSFYPCTGTLYGPWFSTNQSPSAAHDVPEDQRSEQRRRSQACAPCLAHFSIHAQLWAPRLLCGVCRGRTRERTRHGVRARVDRDDDRSARTIQGAWRAILVGSCVMAGSPHRPPPTVGSLFQRKPAARPSPPPRPIPSRLLVQLSFCFSDPLSSDSLSKRATRRFPKTENTMAPNRAWRGLRLFASQPWWAIAL